MTSNTQVALDKEELRSLIAHILDLDVEEITDDADFVRDLEVDSLMVLEIVVRLQRQYGVKLEERDLKNVSSLPQVLRLISDRRTEQFAA
ncbi:acyl carrier protein (plasmid) [Streptomyces sp. NBC_01260]|uniref:acyl carrier protein n=1 Tax=unclassified Streptomyces TaxID=2593676 RepID=UPI000F484E3C|nr:MULTISPECIES: acyl carrier protein [unclassified Streptomyces]MCX4775232.1 acyl carrier protein [Streptomyces sp. NBC_01285]ROQ65353.1 acyl carrier protein [Streptomyces sp. CEV 2-1]RPK32915.1 Acyl carrier protein [Streptomyces sp. ADI92-24]